MAEPARLRLTAALMLYAAATCYAMAAMNIGAAVVVLASIAAAGGLAAYGIWLAGGWAVAGAWRLCGRLTVALLVACLLSLLGAVVAPLPYGNLRVDAGYLREFARVWHLALPLLLAPALAAVGPAGRRRVADVWLLALLLVGIVGVQQYFTGWPRPQPIPNHDPRFHATLWLGHHLTVASSLIFPFFVALDGIKDFRGARRLLAVAAAGAGGLTLFLTYSRMAWVALPAGLLAWVLLALPWRRALAAFAALALVGAATASVPAVRARLLDPMGVGERQLFWQAHRHFLAERPLAGGGLFLTRGMTRPYLESVRPGLYNPAGHAHNNALEMGAGTGYTGLLAWLAWSLGVLALAWRRARRPMPGWGAGLFAAWVAFQVNGLTQVNFWDARALHAAMWSVAWLLALELADARREGVA